MRLPTIIVVVTLTTTISSSKWELYEPTNSMYYGLVYFQLFYNFHVKIGGKWVRNFEEAANFCYKIGGTLASIHSEEENKFIQGLATNTLEENLGHQGNHGYIMVFGLRRVEGTLNDFKYMDGSEYKYSNWKKGEPNRNSSDGIENCVGVYLPPHQYFSQWADIPCTLGFTSQICQKPGNLSEQTVRKTTKMSRTTTLKRNPKEMHKNTWSTTTNIPVVLTNASALNLNVSDEVEGFSAIYVVLLMVTIFVFSITIVTVLKKIRRKRQRQTFSAFLEMSNGLPTENEQFSLEDNVPISISTFSAENHSYEHDHP